MNLILRTAIVFGVAILCAAADMQQITILRDETQYYITPWLTRLSNGDLLVTAREAHARNKEQRGHVDPTARGVYVRSRDGGKTWSTKRVFDDQTYRFSETQDVPVTQLSDGSLLVNMYSWAVSPLPTSFLADSHRFFSSTFEGEWTVRSTDDGNTWSQRRPVKPAGIPPISARVPPLELPDHTLVMAVYDEGPKRSGLDWSRCWLIRSSDMGTTWGSPSLMAEDPEYRRNFEEPSLTRLRNGKLISMIRITTGVSPLWPASKEGYLWQTESSDDGHTWSKPFKTNIWGHPAEIVELRDGRLLCVYGYRRAPFGVRASLSKDGGKTWDVSKEIVLRSDGGSGDLGYPSSVQFEDGRVLTVYWINHEKNGDPQSEARYVAGTIYKP